LYTVELVNFNALQSSPLCHDETETRSMNGG